FNISSTLRLSSWISGTIKYQYTSQNTRGNDLLSIDSYFTRDLINKYTNPTTYKRNIPIGGIMDISSSNLKSHYLRGQLNFQKDWNSIHNLTGILAGELGTTARVSNGYRIYGLDEEVWSYANNVNYS